MRKELKQTLAKLNQLTLQKQEMNKIKGIMFTKYNTKELNEVAE